MKILVINKFFFLKGGSESVFFQERKFLEQNGYKIIDFSMDNPANQYSEYRQYFISNVDLSAEEKQNGNGMFSKLADGLRFISNAEAKAKIKNLIYKERPDIAHMHNIYHQLTPSIIPILKKAGIKTVLTLHDYKLVCPSYLMLRNGNICNMCEGKHFWHAVAERCQDASLAKSALLALEAYWHKWRKSYNYIDVFISPSRFLASLVREHRGDVKHIEIIPNGIQLKNFEPSYKDNRYILFFGRLTAQKGVETLLRAYESLKIDGAEPLDLKIVGDGPMLDILKEKFIQIEFMGKKEGSELKNLVGQASFVVVPSQGYENCSMAVLEAMAMGKPVIASNIGGLPEQVEDGKTGFLFEMGNVEELAEKMNILVHDKELRLKMGRAARKKVEKEYSFDVHGQKLLKLYEKLLSGEYA